MKKKGLHVKSTVAAVCMILAMLCGGKSAVAQDYAVDEFEEIWTLLQKVSIYVDQTPQARATYLRDTNGWNDLPDLAILLKDLQALFQKTIEGEEALHDIPMEGVLGVEAVNQFYEDIKETSVVFDDFSTTLPDEVVEAMDAALTDSTSCTECSSSTGTTGGSNQPKMICSGTLNSMLLILNAYFSCTPMQRIVFRDTYCNYPCAAPDSPCNYMPAGDGSDCSDKAYQFLSKYGSLASSSGNTGTAGSNFSVPLDVLIEMDISRILMQ